MEKLDSRQRAFLTHKILETFDGEDQDQFNEFVEDLNKMSDEEIKGIYNAVKD